MKTTNLLAILLAALVANIFSERAWSDTFGSGANTFNVDFVAVGNPGNAGDTSGNRNPVGSVPYVYRMGTYEISRDTITKANNLGNLAITLSDMTSFGGNGADRPATGVSWNEAARFVNWLNTSTGSPPAYKFATQPGNGGYNPNADIQLWTPSDAGYNPNNLYRNSLAHYFLPSIDEWYKAAYYDPTSSLYYSYPTGSEAPPTPVASGTAAGTAVYFGQSGPANITLAGGLSPYGTMGQGGNAYEWEETDFDLVNGPTVSSSARGYRGGDWSSSPFQFSASALDAFSGSFSSAIPTVEDSGIGFRVASTPEPSTLLLAAMAGAGLLLRRRR